MRAVDLYYALKPLIPRPLQVRLRQRVGRSIRRRCGDVWPIDEKAGCAPPGWPGWPEGKEFALVLTHDVEGAKGLDRCLRLANLDEKAGFRASFYFVPGPRDQVPPSLREELVHRGFEVGLHGLLHDGRDFGTRALFNQRRPAMNRFLAEWKAVGFRAPSMISNLDWIRDLNIRYDSSTFDTDPFEPIPSGVRTIFPFRIEGSDGRPGYIELPYTLPQDFTAHVLFGDEGKDLWRRKLDWIASKGGLAMLITHPDYQCFAGRPSSDEYPVERYQEFLEYVRSTYGGRFWGALARDVADYCAAPDKKQSMPVMKLPERRLSTTSISG